MTRLTPNDIIRAIDQLPKNRSYNYIEPATRTKIEVVRVQEPEGPIYFKRYNPEKGGTAAAADEETISAGFIRRIAYAATPGGFLNFDRIVAGSYNVRSLFEALLAHTPQFYFCYPGRIEIGESSSAIKEGHKHLMWLPNDPHEAGKMVERKVEGMTISEIPGRDAIYEPLVLSPESLQLNAQTDTPVAPEVLRRHSLIQIALVEIGRQLGFKTWVAQNDQGIVYKDKRLGEMEGVLVRLGDVPLLAAFQDAVNAAKLIDVVWFRNARFMPAVIEIEHTTGVTSGLTRMKNFKDRIPQYPTRWVIAAADEDRDKVIQECNKPQFIDMNAQFFPYSAVDELYSLCQRRKIKGVNDDFLDCFMEPCVPALQ
jgi:type II restriction enzyme